MIEMTKYGVKLHGRSIPMANMEQKLLAYFMEHPNTALSREKIFREVWGYEEPGISRTIDVHVKLLRRHLGPCGKCISTVRGVGYRMECDIEKEAS